LITYGGIRRFQTKSDNRRDVQSKNFKTSKGIVAKMSKQIFIDTVSKSRTLRMNKLTIYGNFLDGLEKADAMLAEIRHQGYRQASKVPCDGLAL